MSFFSPRRPSSMFVCFPISSCLPPLRVCVRVGLYHIMLLLFLCSQFILLPCHPIMCCANRVLLCLRSEWMMELSRSRTRVTVCSFSGPAAQVHAIEFGLRKVFSASVVFLAGRHSLIVAPSLSPLLHLSCSWFPFPGQLRYLFSLSLG